MNHSPPVAPPLVVGWMDSTLFDEHVPGSGHPEQPARLVAIRQELRRRDLDVALQHEHPPEVNRELLERVHCPEYVATIEQARGGDEPLHLDADTVVSSGTCQAAWLAAGAAAGAVAHVLAGRWTRAFCSVRPPGHHAMRESGQGFCIFNNIAIAAEAALASGEVERIAILDFDAHHGDGTQSLLQGRPGVFYASWHQWPFYPGTGAASDRGTGPGVVVNCPVPQGATGADLMDAWHGRVRPALEEFQPDLLLLSAGFDADVRDPLAELSVKAQDFFQLTWEIVNFANAHCAGRIVSVLEGGYDLEALGRDVAAHVEALLGYPFYR